MAFNMAKDTFYFSHDYSARQDEKIKNLIRKHGMVGYGIFWSIIEDLYNNANALRTDYEGIGYDLRVDKKVAESIVSDFDLFVFNDDLFGSLSVQRRIEERDKKSQKARESAFRKWEIVRTQSERNANASKSDAIKERKGKERKEINTNYNDFVSMTEKEYQTLVTEITEARTKKAIEILGNYKGSTGKTYKSDYLAIKNWVIKRLVEDESKLGLKQEPKDIYREIKR